MSWINCLWFLILFISLENAVNGQSTLQVVYHPRRHFDWVKHLKNHERHKYKSFTKRFRKCGFPPYKLKFFRRSDLNNLDTIQVIVPYGYSGEYFPQRPHKIIPIETRSHSSKTGD
ncbi:uncharacterized protein LOC123014847 [Tribolium madens]|uniref:uncharacterized protein LOC123014847 n=1 Tax=Tribolium madens TaxID=41895 RepID=UPI001CF76671|nr:uncharacterized protein LOC123014847 [Tribolium madens]